MCFIQNYRPQLYLFKNDHTYPGVNKTHVPVVILYAEIGTKKFVSFHKVLSEKAQEGKLLYVLRHFVAVSEVGLSSAFKCFSLIVFADFGSLACLFQNAFISFKYLFDSCKQNRSKTYCAAAKNS